LPLVSSHLWHAHFSFSLEPERQKGAETREEAEEEKGRGWIGRRSREMTEDTEGEGGALAIPCGPRVYHPADGALSCGGRKYALRGKT